MSSSVKGYIETPKGRIAEVAIPRRLDRILHYSIPDRLLGRLSPGMRLLVPLGRSKITGYLVGISAQGSPDGLKEIVEVLDDTPVVNNEILDLARWASEYYMQPLGLMIRAAIPGGIDIKSKHYFRLKNPDILIRPNINSIKGNIYSILNEKAGLPAPARPAGGGAGWVSLSEILKETGLKSKEGRILHTLSKMIEEGVLDEEIRIVGRRNSSKKKEKISNDIKKEIGLPSLQGREEDLVKEMKGLINKGIYAPYLLSGIKKDARERIYLHLISLCIKKGRGALLLIHEILPNLSLIKNLEETFRGRMALLHSRISEGRRLDIISQVREGKIDIIVGTRSAIFTPIDMPGIIIVDEEDDPSYKQDKGLRYNAKGVALKRGERLNIPVILGSFAPCVEDFYCGMTGIYRLRTLDNNPLEKDADGYGDSGGGNTEIKIIDMRGVKGRPILSDQLKSAIVNRIERGERVLLFVNKRGFSNSIICQDCGYYFRCPDCALSLTYYKGIRRLSCHYCNKSINAPATCPECGSSRLMEVGIGTERLEDEVRKIFPNVKQVRLDRDTVKGIKGQEGKGEDTGTTDPTNPGTFKKEGEIVIATDIVMRSHDIRPFALVGVVSADIGLHLPDFRISHRIYKLLLGLIDLAGMGEIIIQTRNPFHHAIEAVSNPSDRGLDRFYLKEIGLRKELNYPPFSSMVIITIEGRDAERCIDRSQRLGKILLRNLDHGTELLGPARGYPEMVKGRHRWQMILKGNRPLQGIIKKAIEELEGEVSTSGIRVDLDIDP